MTNAPDTQADWATTNAPAQHPMQTAQAASNSASQEPQPAQTLPEPSLVAFSPDKLAALLPLPQPDANKYSRGRAVVVGGCATYPGAACLAARASQRSGAGYTLVYCAPESLGAVRASSPSLVARSWDALDPESFTPARPGKPAAYVVGCGLDASEKAAAAQAKRLVCLVLKHAEAPVVVDGGGLQALATEKGRRLLCRRFTNGWPSVVTPHAGEAARLAAPFSLPTADPCRLAQLLALAYGVVAVVKGPVTFISDGESVVRMDKGTAALAKAGTGDVLAGITGALLAQGMLPLDACVLAAHLHAQAGVCAAQRLTEICVCAEDVVDALPLAIQSIAKG